jgi:hypothetical protein
MKNNQLDKKIKEKLEGLRPPLPPDSWEQFEQRLSEAESGIPETREKAVDEALFKKLHQLEVPYRSGSWPSLEKRLDREFVRPEVVMRYKTVELLLVLLIVLTFWQYKPAPVVESPNPVAGMESTAPPAATADAEASSSSGGSNTTAATAPLKKEPQTVVTTPAVNDLLPGKTIPLPSSSISFPELPRAGSSRQQEASALSPLAHLDLTGRQPLSTQKEDLKVSPPFKGGFNLPPANAGLLAALDAKSSAGVLVEAARQSFRLQPNHNRRYLYFSMFGSMDYNRVMTPSERFFDVETHAFDRYALGYSGGFSLGFEWGRFELQSGAIYSSKRYRSLQLQIRHGNSRDGYSTEQLKDITLNILHIPLNFRYNFFQYDRWRLYTLAGASLQVATQANYFVDSNGTARSSVLSDFIENGWFEGGSFRENSYLSANRGSIFAQPTYQHALFHLDEGFGPTSDHINTMSILTGIRIRMQRN